jgi:hypothetical protein
LARFQIKCFEHEAVVFDAESGDTHYLPQLVYALYLTSRDRPGLSTEHLRAAVASGFEYGSEAEFGRLFDDAMRSLHKIGLLQTA